MEFTEERPERTLRVRQYKAANIQKPCRIYECSEHREGLSRYCKTHADRAGSTGSPTFRPIDQLTGIAPLAKKLTNQIKAQELPDLEKRLIANIVKGLPRDQQYVYRNREIESGLKTVEKARIILATASRIAGPEQVCAFGVLWAIACEIDGPLHSNKAQQKAFSELTSVTT